MNAEEYVVKALMEAQEKAQDQEEAIKELMSQIERLKLIIGDAKWLIKKTNPEIREGALRMDYTYLTGDDLEDAMNALNGLGIYIPRMKNEGEKE